MAKRPPGINTGIYNRHVRIEAAYEVVQIFVPHNNVVG
jgi:hypothetical protein